MPVELTAPRGQRSMASTSSISITVNLPSQSLVPYEMSSEWLVLPAPPALPPPSPPSATSCSPPGNWAA